MQFFNQLGSMLGQDVGGYAQGPNQTGDAGVGRTGINYGQVLKTLGLTGMSQQDQQDMNDYQGLSQLVGLWMGGGMGGGGTGGGM